MISRLDVFWLRDVHPSASTTGFWPSCGEQRTSLLQILRLISEQLAEAWEVHDARTAKPPFCFGSTQVTSHKYDHVEDW